MLVPPCQDDIFFWLKYMPWAACKFCWRSQCDSGEHACSPRLGPNASWWQGLRAYGMSPNSRRGDQPNTVRETATQEKLHYISSFISMMRQCCEIPWKGHVFIFYSSPASVLLSANLCTMGARGSGRGCAHNSRSCGVYGHT